MCGSFEVSRGNGRLVRALLMELAVLEDSDSPGLTTAEDHGAIDAVGQALAEFYGGWDTPISDSVAWQREHGRGRASFIGYIKSELEKIRAAELQQ